MFTTIIIMSEGRHREGFVTSLFKVNNLNQNLNNATKFLDKMLRGKYLDLVALGNQAAK